ncbi:MAG TPA: hypothetical protein V6D47_16140 [Oscillatoriaceae cyanobacterium]
MKRLVFLLALGLGIAACTDDPAVQQWAVDHGVASNTALPATATAPVAPPSTTATSTAAPSPASTTAPVSVPGMTNNYVKTFNPLDVAIAGPGYFCVATRPNPQSLDDIFFTRYGHFEFDFVPAASSTPEAGSGPGTWRLMTPDGLYVLGFTTQSTQLPAEARGTTLSTFTLGGSGGPTLTAAPIGVDAMANPTFEPRFNFQGQLTNQTQAPVDSDGNDQLIYLAIAQFDAPGGLNAHPGETTYNWISDAGTIDVGIAGVRAEPDSVPRPVGAANLIRPETLEE